jgi:hypothetical protein
MKGSHSRALDGLLFDAADDGCVIDSEKQAMSFEEVTPAF